MQRSCTSEQLELDFKRCERCGVLDRADWVYARAKRTNGSVWCRGTKERGCGSRSFNDPASFAEAEMNAVVSGWFEDENNAG